MRLLRGLLCVLFTVLLVPAASAQEERTGGISGMVFFEFGAGAGGKVFGRAYRASDTRAIKGACADGNVYEILGLAPGLYKLRFGFGCGQGGERGPYEWFDGDRGTDAPVCAALVRVVAGEVTDTINLSVNETTGPRNPCSPVASTPREVQGIRRPIRPALSPTATPTDEIPFTPGVVATPGPSTPLGTVIGASAGALLALGAFGWWLYRRVTTSSS